MLSGPNRAAGREVLLLGRWMGDAEVNERRLQRLPPGRTKLLLPGAKMRRLATTRGRLLQIEEKPRAARQQLDPPSQRAGVVETAEFVGRARECHRLGGRRGRSVGGGVRHNKRHIVEASKLWHKIVGGDAELVGELSGEGGGFGRPRMVEVEEGICGVGSRRPAAEIGMRL